MEQAQAHVVALAIPFGTHAGPVLTVIRGLAALSPTTWFSFLSTRASNAAVTSGVCLPPNVRTYDVWDGAPEGYVQKGSPLEAIEMFIEAARESFREGIKMAVEERQRPVTCLITDSFYWFGREIADEMGGVPWLTSWMGAPASLSVHINTDLLRQTLSAEDSTEGRKDELLKHFPGLSKMTVSDIPEGVLVAGPDSVFSDMLHKMGRSILLSDAVFLNSFEELAVGFTDHLKTKLKNCLDIGPLNLILPPPKAPDTYNCIDWLGKRQQASVAYIGFGSMAVPPPHELVALAEALETRNVPFIWSLKDSARAHLPDGFLERTTSSSSGLVVPWAPQTDILGHNSTGVFITHGGWGSVVESVVGGVPMICRPFFGDHGLSARMVADVWGIGVSVKTLTMNGVVDCLDEVLVRKNGKKMKEAVLVLREKALAAVEPQGSSTNNYRTLLEFVTIK